MPAITTSLAGWTATVKPTANVRSAPLIKAPVLRVVSASESWAITGWVTGDVDPESGSNQWVCRWAGGKWEYTASANLSAGPRTPVADCAPAVKAATDPLRATLAQQAALLVELKAQVAEANALRSALRPFIT